MQEIQLTKLSMVIDNTIKMLEQYKNKIDMGFSVEGKDKEFFDHLIAEFLNIKAQL